MGSLSGDTMPQHGQQRHAHSDSTGGWARSPNNPFLLLGSSQWGKISCPPRALGKESVQSSHTGHRLCLPNPPPRHSARTSLVILVAPRTAQPPEEPSCHHGNAEREGLKPAGTFNLCQEKQGP